MASATNILEPDRGEIEEFLSEVLADAIQLTAITPDGPIEAHYFDDDAEAAAIWADRENRRGRNVYFTVNVPKPANKKPAKGDILSVRFAHVDVDPPKDGSAFDKAEAAARLDTLSCAPNFIIDTGGGLAGYWRIGATDATVDEIERVNRGIAQALAADHCWNIDRIMRLPGTVNYPDRRKQARGRDPAMASIWRTSDGGSYAPGALATAFPFTEEGPQAQKAEPKPLPPAIEVLTSDDLGLDPLDPIRSVIDNPTGKDRSNDVLRCAGDMVRAGYSREQIAGILLNPANAVSAHIFDQSDPRRAALKTIDKAFRDQAKDRDSTEAGPDQHGRPTIRVRAGALHLMATDAEKALIRGAAPFYDRGGIVRPIIDEVPASHGRRTKVARLAPVDANMLVDHLSRVSRWEKYDGRSKGWVTTDPVREVAAIVLSRDGEWRFPRLAGVITTPTLRPDGTLLLDQGYDQATQLLLLDPPAMPTIMQRPDKAEAIAALAFLDALLDEFPFIDDASRSVALSGLITPVVRGAMSVAPLHATTAPVAGSGKSYIIDIASGIATGQRAPVIAAGRTEEETEKRLGAALLNGQPIVSIDNVNGQLGGDALCQYIERPTVSVRPLGVSKLVKIESRATMFATGNNIHLVGDMTRRTLLCSLDPNMERPELREFKANPFDQALANRGDYVAAALTVVRSYVAADCPGALPALASFEEWSRIVRSALVWLGRADPCETMERARADDPVIAGLSAILRAWYEAAGGTGYTAGGIRELTDLKNPFGNVIHGELFDALHEVADDRRGGIDTRRLGHYLTRHQGRVIDGLKFIVTDDSHAKQKVWRVVRV